MSKQYEYQGTTYRENGVYQTTGGVRARIDTFQEITPVFARAKVVGVHFTILHVPASVGRKSRFFDREGYRYWESLSQFGKAFWKEVQP